jgi:hypothetical protein
MSRRPPLESHGCRDVNDVEIRPHARFVVGMKHISFADKTMFLDDETADALMEYAGLLAAEHSGDTVTVRAVGQDGNETDATFVLNMATNLIAESTNSTLDPPENPVALKYMLERIALIRDPPPGRPMEPASLTSDPLGSDDET